MLLALLVAAATPASAACGGNPCWFELEEPWHLDIYGDRTSVKDVMAQYCGSGDAWEPMCRASGYSVVDIVLKKYCEFDDGDCLKLNTNPACQYGN